MPRISGIAFVAVLGWSLTAGAPKPSAALSPDGLPVIPGEEKLHDQFSKALARGRTHELDALLTAHPALINARVVYNGVAMSPIHFAAYAKNERTLRCLLAHGAKADVFVAAAFGNLADVKRFVRADPRSVHALYGGTTPLGIATRHEHPAVVKYLLDQGADVEYRDEDGELTSDLLEAASQSSEEIFDAVLAKAKWLNFETPFGSPVNLVALREDTSRLEKLIKRKADLNIRSLDGNTPLHNAALIGHTKAVELLLRAGCQHYLVNEFGLTPLQYGLVGYQLGIRPATAQRLATARLLVKNGVDLDFCSAVALGDLAKVREGLKRDPWAVLPVNPVGLSPRMQALVRFHWALAECPAMLEASGDSSLLHLAARFGQAEVIELLIERGCPVEAHGPRPGADRILDLTANRDLGTALHVAAEEGHAKAVAALLKAGADPDSLDHEGQTPLHRAAAKGHAEVVRLLLAAWCGRYLVDKGRYTPLSWAIQSGDLETVKALLDAKVPPDLSDGRGESPLEWACRAGRLNTFRLLCERGADFRGTSRRTGGNAALFQAAASDRPEIIEYLALRGVPVDSRMTKGRPGWTPLHQAAAVDCVRAGEVLLRLGSQVNATDDLGQTPLHVAAAHGHDRFVVLLLLNGARTTIRDKDGKSPRDYALTGRKSALTWLWRITG